MEQRAEGGMMWVWQDEGAGSGAVGAQDGTTVWQGTDTVERRRSEAAPSARNGLRYDSMRSTCTGKGDRTTLNRGG